MHKTQTITYFEFNFQILSAALTSSYAFMLPVATAPNAIVFDASTMKVSDMIGAGFGMNVITLLTTAAAINTFAIPIFGLDSFPEWAVASLPVNQTCIAQM
jgi:sodium-dependent dicarboxylate transporter 2/3/5